MCWWLLAGYENQNDDDNNNRGLVLYLSLSVIPNQHHLSFLFLAFIMLSLHVWRCKSLDMTTTNNLQATHNLERPNLSLDHYPGRRHFRSFVSLHSFTGYLHVNVSLRHLQYNTPYETHTDTHTHTCTHSFTTSEGQNSSDNSNNMSSQHRPIG